VGHDHRPPLPVIREALPFLRGHSPTSGQKKKKEKTESERRAALSPRLRILCALLLLDAQSWNCSVSSCPHEDEPGSRSASSWTFVSDEPNRIKSHLTESQTSQLSFALISPQGPSCSPPYEYLWRARTSTRPVLVRSARRQPPSKPSSAHCS
jgi:hypothetical protein